MSSEKEIIDILKNAYDKEDTSQLRSEITSIILDSEFYFMFLDDLEDVDFDLLKMNETEIDKITFKWALTFALHENNFDKDFIYTIQIVLLREAFLATVGFIDEDED